MSFSILLILLEILTWIVTSLVADLVAAYFMRWLDAEQPPAEVFTSSETDPHCQEEIEHRRKLIEETGRIEYTEETVIRRWTRAPGHR